MPKIWIGDYPTISLRSDQNISIRSHNNATRTVRTCGTVFAMLQLAYNFQLKVEINIWLGLGERAMEFWIIVKNDLLLIFWEEILSIKCKVKTFWKPAISPFSFLNI